MVFALQGFTKEFIALQRDGIGVEYTGKGEKRYTFITYDKAKHRF